MLFTFFYANCYEVISIIVYLTVFFAITAKNTKGKKSDNQHFSEWCKETCMGWQRSSLLCRCLTHWRADWKRETSWPTFPLSASFLCSLDSLEFLSFTPFRKEMQKGSSHGRNRAIKLPRMKHFLARPSF